MTESVNFSANSAPHTIDSAMLKSNNTSQARVDRGEKVATQQASPDVAITEVASKAAAGKKKVSTRSTRSHRNFGMPLTLSMRL